ncbi:MAG: hypothetical protein OEP95_11240 [Myxococcales bacterium]|nr:hypothetical protein [Myxococcales bacterium]
MRTPHTALLTGLLALAFGLTGSLVPSEASALVFCAKTRNPSKIKVRGDACKASETEVSVLGAPEVQGELDALASNVDSLASDVDGLTTDVDNLMSQSHIYVKTDFRPGNGGNALIGTAILCDEGDVATGGGVTSNSAGSTGPFVHYSGPALDDLGNPIGWRIGIGQVSNDIEFHVICAAVGGPFAGSPNPGPGPGVTPPVVTAPPGGTITLGQGLR